MASIKKRGDGYSVRWRDPDGTNRRRQVPTRRAAEALAREVAETAAVGRRWEPADARPLPHVRDLAAAWLTSCARTKADRTVIEYGRRLDLLERFLSTQDGRRRWTPADLTPSLMEDGWRWLVEGGRSRGHADQVIATWERAREWGARDEVWREWTPTYRRLERAEKSNRRRKPAPTWAQIDAMVAALEEPRRWRQWEFWERRAVLLGRYAGLRAEAALLLDWSQVDLNAGVLDVPDRITKGGYGGRRIPIHPALADELARWGVRKGPVCGVPEDKAWSSVRSQLSMEVRRAWERTEAPSEVYHRAAHHCLRRALRTHLTAAGTQADIIDAILGHAGQGTGAQVYLDRAAPRVWQAMVEAIKSVPAVGASRAPRRLRSTR